MSEKDISTAEVSPRLMDRLLPPRSFRRTATFVLTSLSVSLGVLHYEIGRLQETQESGITGVKTEVAQQAGGIKDPLLEKLGEADLTLKQGSDQLKVCQRVADRLGISEKPTSGTNEAASPTTVTTSTTPTTTVAGG